jgi:hypothetical protein
MDPPLVLYDCGPSCKLVASGEIPNLTVPISVVAEIIVAHAESIVFVGHILIFLSPRCVLDLPGALLTTLHDLLLILNV